MNKQKEQINSLKNELDSLNNQLQQKLNEKFKSKNEKIKTDDIVVKGCILKLTLNLNDATNDFEVFKLSKQQIKSKFLNEENEEAKEISKKIAYFEVQKNYNRIMIRCISNEAAKSLLAEKNFFPKFNKVLLDGNEELEYLEKIFSNREKKQFKKEKKEKKKHTNVTLPSASISEQIDQ